MATTDVHSQPSSPHRSSRSFGGFVRQTLKLTRTEFVLFYRYRVALFAAVIPGVFVLPAFLGDEGEILPGVGGIAYTLAGMFALAGMTVGIIHLANVYTARREQMVLKRFRLGGTPPRTLFAASTLSVLGIAVLQAIAIILVIGLRLDTWPQDPVMLAFSIVLVTVAMSLFGIAITPMARDAENAQMMSMGPFILFTASSGFFIPLSIMPEWLSNIVAYGPMVPAVDMARSAYFGYDFFAGSDQGAQVATVPELWVAAIPSILILLAWAVLAAFLLRRFRWDPRDGK